MKAQVHYQDQPLQHLKLQGLHLIEASAGTGKTWTLSSLMVRILTEKYMPRQVIATTFTRAAAAELKTRIRLRLLDIFKQAQHWEKLSVSEYAQYLQQLSDPLEKWVFQLFSDAENEQRNFHYLNNRLKLIIDSLDELFVGTIDSFTQKLLREFSFESGEIEPRQMTENENQYPYQIVHDALRAWLQQQQQSVVDLLLFSQSLKTVDEYIKTVKNTLNFSQAKLLTVTEPVLDIVSLQQCIAEFIQHNTQQSEQLKEYYLINGQYAKAFDGRSWKKGVLQQLFEQDIPKFSEQLQQLGFFVLFDASSKSILLKLTKLAQHKGIKAPDSTEIQAFLQHPSVKSACHLAEISDQLNGQLKQLDAYLRYYLSCTVKQQLPQLLLQASETTFNQQIQTLAHALTHEKGQQMAQAIQHRYPIILVDEFQDTNQEQDNVLNAIWRHHDRIDAGCFIAVGDPKQAIYGFRGGDILTYLNAFNDLAQKKGHFYRLQQNFRSTPALVTAVDALFRRQINFGEDIEYYPAIAGKSTDNVLIEKQQTDTAPLRLLSLPEGSHEGFVIAQKIRHLLVQAQDRQLFIQDQQQKYTIVEDDIAVLAYSNYELDQVQHELEKLNIRVNRVAMRSVFSSVIAQEIAAILQAILQPDREEILRRALMTRLIGMHLSEFIAFEQHADAFSTHMTQFRQARQTWLQKGFLIAWQDLAEHYQFWGNLAKHTGQQAERSIVNARHIIELLSQKSQYYQGLQHLQQWYLLQLGSPAQRDWEMERKLSSESGVQLMTIHKSKGLEFKIVFLMGANKEVSNKSDLIFYEEQQTDQSSRVIAIASQEVEKNVQALQANDHKIQAENHRLWYVALTRASYRLYLSLPQQNKKIAVSGAAAFWLEAQEQAFCHPAVAEECIESPDTAYQRSQQQILQLTALNYPVRQFYPKTRTSFSYLAAHVKHQTHIDVLAEWVEQDQAAQDEYDIQQQTEENIFQDSQPEKYHQTELQWIRLNFPRGTLAGNCLHELLEHLDFQQQQDWQQEINRQLYQYGLWTDLLQHYQQDFDELNDTLAKQQLLTWVQQWLESIVKTPIQATQSNLTLQQLKPEHRLSEFPFFLALAQQRFDSQKIHTFFVQYGWNMPEFEAANTARFLNGAIDLVYFDGQRYHIADYKSNTLGQYLENYQIENIRDNMTHSSYWLQASLYLVALHRYLGQRLNNYDPEQHLGGASYLYLRGMTTDCNYGVCFWQPDIEFILQLDSLLGGYLVQ
ncbi:AAA family ATPase [Acinetobacter qingfengensis]|uniref:RecBCD enzyme subunit RecB n=1 Tax=Acinetobacter qingfengensis TaxID=1262585 RepID=A0A1E7R388_9GAMM|nr:UvrD-helicase domain-containing protein [Acinetobacter qingfengensis]KAA8733752.1 AAA family ATPase [Acinetobacter qingfengensis]OEY93737.1 hypothetical protein BJI46_04655 [Acinetobacter qingfengensis]